MYRADIFIGKEIAVEVIATRILEIRGRMSIVEPVIRPPAEADSFLLQVTLGCSADSCSFCGAYKSKTFRVKDRKEITADINWHARRYQDTRRVFLMDGDALVLANSKLVPILEELDEVFPRLKPESLRGL